ncbi:HBL296Wp [Eremothecium sinecaudum]|uniref:HBL296Wp n=1 Tax=Eremothecium sinecaudum TaxID=45286 RepID=A0A125RDU3_9SACH|nr:HBL296Wp [Eremothecium sinecaudum]AMD18606.1 HBL296Wp [Eremothecium sinecaudum]
MPGECDLMRLTPQKEQELSSIILKRAELAQMTRQLKLGLSKVSSPKKSSRAPSSSSELNSGTLNRDSTSLQTVGAGGSLTTRLEAEQTDTKQTYSRDTDEESPLKKHKAMLVVGPQEPQAVTRRSSLKPLLPSTPRAAARRPSIKFPPFSTASYAGEPTSNNEEVGADLLIYLATSPYSSTKHLNHTGSPKVPMTPSYLSQHTASTDAVRLSHMKSQPSPFKHPVQFLNGAPSALLPQGPLHDLMDSPNLSLYMSPSPQKRKHSTSSILPTDSLLEHSTAPDTFRRPSTSQPLMSHLLRTPNFDMNDYVRNLFSPSPRVDSHTMHQTLPLDRKD